MSTVLLTVSGLQQSKSGCRAQLSEVTCQQLTSAIRKKPHSEGRLSSASDGKL